MKHELIARYIYAVVRHLPHKTRADVERELESLISDMLDARCGGVLPADKDVRVVLTELGTPGELAAQYSGGERKALIGGAYYIVYVRVLKLVLPIVAAAAALGTLISVLTNPGENPLVFTFRLIGQPIGGVIAGAIQAFAVVTVIFACLEHFKADLGGSDLSDLPMVPKTVERIKPYEPILGILFALAGSVVFLAFPQIIGFWRDGVWLPILDADAVRGFWPFIVLWAVLVIATESFKLIEGRYTKRLAAILVIANMILMGSTAVVFLSSHIVNPDFAALWCCCTAVKLVDYLGVIITVSVCFALTIESAVTVVRAYRYSGGGQND
jgi:hypothetical protein